MNDRNDIPERLRKYVLDEELVPPRSIVLHKGTDHQITYWPVKRLELLALADEITESYVTGGADGDELVMSRGAVLFVARRIREALGEVDE